MSKVHLKNIFPKSRALKRDYRSSNYTHQEK